MSVLGRLTRAEVSSDLEHHTYDCHVDVLGAAGMAASHHYGHMSVFRIKYLNDATELDAAKRLFIMWARRSMIRRQISPSSASRVGVQALTHWVDDICPVCRGVRYVVPDGTPVLSDKQCSPCNGTGKRVLKLNSEHAQVKDMIEVFKDLFERADSACNTIQRNVEEKLE